MNYEEKKQEIISGLKEFIEQEKEKIEASVTVIEACESMIARISDEKERD